MDFVEFFNILLDLSTVCFANFILVGVELPLCVVVTLSWTAVACFLESG